MNTLINSAITFLLIATSFILTSCGTGSGPQSIPDPPSNPGGGTPGTLVWSEEFNGSSLDSTTWNVETGATGWGNNEWQEYTTSSDNLKVESGNLSITARCDSGVCGDKDGTITSARINTKDKVTFQYGTIKARIKAPAGQGMWSAFWMLGANFDSVGWPTCGEVDIMEIFDGASTNDRVHTVLHWDDGGHVYEGDSVQFPGPLSDDYHVYELEWSANQVTGRVDDQQIFTKFINPTTMSEFRNDFFLVLNVAVGGNLGATPVTNTAWQHEMLVDWIRVYDSTVGPVVPPTPGTTAGIFSETHTGTTIPYSNIVNSADWSGNITVPDDTSTAVTPADGSVVLAADYQLGITNWGGIALALNGADMSPYSTLAFSLDSSAIATYDDLKIEVEDSSAAKSAIQLAGYNSTTSANWKNYEIPLSDFGGANLSSVNYLGFYSPVDTSDNLVSGSLYFDNIYLNQGCVAAGDVMLRSLDYPADSTSTTITVADACAASTTTAVAVDNGVETISVDVALDANGHGSATLNFGPTDDGTDTLNVIQGDTVTATYNDNNGNDQTDAALVAAAGPATLVGDDDGDGAVYLYATDALTEIDLDDGAVNYNSVDNWSSGATLDNAYAGDAVYNPAFSVTPGTGWTVSAGAAAFIGFNSGFATTYNTVHFKFKGNYSAVKVKFANGVPGPEQEIEYGTSSVNAADLGNGWHEFSIRLSDFNVLATATEFAILNFGSDPFYLTDIYFE